MEARIADLKEAHEANRKDLMKLVDMLAEQVDYLRMQAGRPSFTKMQPLNPAKQPEFQGGLAHVTEEEEDLMALHEFGHISEATLRDLQSQLDLPNLTLAE